MPRTDELLSAVNDLLRVRKTLFRTVTTSCHQGALGVLYVLSRKGAMRVGQLAETLHVDVSVASRQVAELEQHGFVDRQPDPADGRAHLVFVTAGGEDALTDIRDRVQAHTDQALADWSDDEVGRLTSDLQRLSEALNRAASTSERT